MSIDWIFFDVGGVIIEESAFNLARRQQILEIARQYNSKLTFEDVFNLHEKSSSMIGNIGENMLSLLVPQDKLEECKQQLLDKKKDLPNYFDVKNIRPEIKLVLPELSKKYKIGIIANQHAQIKDVLEQASILRYFDHNEVSREYGFGKPDSRLYQAVLASTSADPKRSVMIDDNIERGLVQAKAMGMTTVWYRLPEYEDRESDAVDYKISNLNELLGIIYEK